MDNLVHVRPETLRLLAEGAAARAHQAADVRVKREIGA